MADSPSSISLVSPKRAAVVLLVVLALFLTLLGRVCWLQTIGRQQMTRKAERQHHQREVIPARRGGIFDRNGLVMAGTVQTQLLFADSKFMYEAYQQPGRSLVEMDQALDKLAKVVDLQSFELIQSLSEHNDERYLKLAEDLDERACRDVQKLNIPGVGLLPTSARYYPMGSLAAHLLGGSGKDGRGLEGLELRYEKDLAGKDGFTRTLKDARHRPIFTAAEDYVPPRHGQHLMLTIDANIQLIAEQELAKTCTEFRAARGEVVVMEPKSGEILALANWPTFNPQNLGDAPDDVRRNRCLTDPYEPGSTLKPFIVGPALAWKVTSLGEIWPTEGGHYKTPYGRSVRDEHAYNNLTTWDGLVKSSNIVMSMLAERMENEKIHRALTGWGFGKAVGVEIPGEDGGMLYPLNKWTKFSTESVAQGYEIMVTPLQLARGFCAYANGGRLVKPTLVKGFLDPEGKLVSARPNRDVQVAPEVIDPSTAAAIKRVLCDTVVRGTATKARSDVWNIFGKTGTAHISEGKSGYSRTKFNSSFLAGAPAEDPKLVVAFIVHEPDTAIAHFGGSVSAPGAKRLIERSLTYLQSAPSPILPQPPVDVASKLYEFDPKIYEKGRAVMADARE